MHYISLKPDVYTISLPWLQYIITSSINTIITNTFDNLSHTITAIDIPLYGLISGKKHL